MVNVYKQRKNNHRAVVKEWAEEFTGFSEEVKQFDEIQVRGCE
jgi:hypothetical protein